MQWKSFDYVLISATIHLLYLQYVQAHYRIWPHDTHICTPHVGLQLIREKTDQTDWDPCKGQLSPAVFFPILLPLLACWCVTPPFVTLMGCIPRIMYYFLYVSFGSLLSFVLVRLQELTVFVTFKSKLTNIKYEIPLNWHNVNYCVKYCIFLCKSRFHMCFTGFIPLSLWRLFIAVQLLFLG